MLRDRAGCDVGGLMERRSALGSAAFSDGFSLKLNRLLVPVDIGLMIDGVMLFLRKSR